ncbi:hypothetical protein [Microbispora sp. NBC_01389]|uniref:hypothetical protein n=1 Tax=Microbispora sp. NBC_01389 TaxID=2903584 RepID=UPI00325529B7
MARDGLPRLQCAALLECLDDHWRPEDAGYAPGFVTDADESVRNAALRLFSTATGATLDALWLTALSDAPLREVLFKNSSPPGLTILQQLWVDSLATVDLETITRLTRWAIPQSIHLLIAERWATSRAPLLRRLVLETGALARDGLPRLQCAALLECLDDHWRPEDAGYAPGFVTDADESVRNAALRLFSTATGATLDALWLTALSDAPLREVLFKNSSPPGLTILQQLWVDSLATVDLETITRLTRWAIPQSIHLLIAERWATSRAPLLRRLVLETGAPAKAGLAKVQSLALLGRLAEDWRPKEARYAPQLLLDADEDVREGALKACRTVTGPTLDALWVHASSSGQLRSLLLDNPSPPPSETLNQLWESWLSTPDPAVWDALFRWHLPASQGRSRKLSVIALEADPERLTAPKFHQALVEAVAFGKHPLTKLAREKVLATREQALFDLICEAAIDKVELVAFCKRHRLAPRDPVRRVVFFLLTGQPEQYHGMDPDGSVLALAYAAVAPKTRTRMQQAMLTSGQLNLVRIIVGTDRRARIQKMSEGELSYLAEQLASRDEWADLWSLIQDLSIAVGVRIIKLFDRWMPRDDDSRRIFNLYRKTDPAVLERAFTQMKKKWPVALRQATIHFQGRVNDVSFAPDAPLLAVAGSSTIAGVIDLTRARLVERYDGFGSSVGRVLHVGGGAFVAGERTNNAQRPCKIIRCKNGKHQTLFETPGSVTSFALTSKDGAFAAGTRSGKLVRGAPDAGPVTSHSVRMLGFDTDDWPRSIAAHLPSGNMAILGKRLVITDPTAAVLARGVTERVIARAQFVSHDTLACAGQAGTIKLLRRNGSWLTEPAEINISSLGGLGAITELNRLAAVDRLGTLYFLSTDSLQVVAKVHGRGYGLATSLNVSPRGEFLAVGNDNGRTDLYDLRISEVPAIVEKPLVNLVPRHLGIVGSAQNSRDVSHEVRVLLTLLYACLEHRFRFDIELGDAVKLGVGDYDISL